MDLSIIIINYRSEHLLKKCIHSIENSKPSLRYEIIVVDNGSEKKIAIKTPAFTLLEDKANVGFGKANNQALEKAKGEYVLFLNVDTEVLDDAITKLFSFLTHTKDADIVGGKLLNTDKTDQPSAGPFYSLPVTFGMLFLKGDHWGLTRYSPSKTKRVDWVSGACMLMKKSTFYAVGGFDENIFMYMDEIDFLYRAKKLGMQVYFFPEAQFIHVGAATKPSDATPIVNIYKGLRYFYRKHGNDIQYMILNTMLLLKASLAIVVGSITGNNYLVSTYKKALSTL